MKKKNKKKKKQEKQKKVHIVLKNKFTYVLFRLVPFV